MILQSLASLYDRLSNDPEADIASYGFTEGKVSWCVVVDDAGNLKAVQDVRDTTGKKPFPRVERVPDCGKRTSGVSPNVLCDGTAYLFGYVPVGKKKNDDREKTLHRAKDCFDAFRARHLSLEKLVDTPSFSAVCRFLERWNPADAETNAVLAPLWPELAKDTGMFVFRREGDPVFVHKIHEVVEAWRRIKANEPGNEDGGIGQCLITGETGIMARIHPPIKGIPKYAEQNIVSFNADAYESYGKKQSMNAPISKLSAFKYTTALNWLLVRNHKQCVRIGDTSNVFWCGVSSTLEQALGYFIDGYSNAQDEMTLASVRAAMGYLNGRRSWSNGISPEEVVAPFYVLGLAPMSKARLAVRFWCVSSLGQTYENLRRHFDDMRIVHEENESEFPAAVQILEETCVKDKKVSKEKNKKAGGPDKKEKSKISETLEDSFMRSMLTGDRYPEALLTALIRRIRADGKVNYLRASGIKAVLTRNYKNTLKTKISMSLNPECKDVPYVLGRLFAAYDRADWLSKNVKDGKIEKSDPNKQPPTIKDKYFSSASATPSMIFPILIKLNRHHIAKLRTSGGTLFAYGCEKTIGDISELIDVRNISVKTDPNGFPLRLALQAQGLFAIGYYHQRSEFFRSKKDKADAVTAEAAAAVSADDSKE